MNHGCDHILFHLNENNARLGWPCVPAERFEFVGGRFVVYPVTASE